jgi:hypothetical protein
MATLLDATKSVKSIPFSGKKDDFFIWSVRILSYCQLQGCQRVLEGVTPVSAANTVIPAANVNELAARKANEVAIILLNMFMIDVVSYGAIYNARTVVQPEGCAATAWRNLLAIYNSVTQAKRHELEQEFN